MLGLSPVLLPESSPPLLALDSLSGSPTQHSLSSDLALPFDPSQSSEDARLSPSGGNRVAVRVPSCALESHEHTTQASHLQATEDAYGAHETLRHVCRAMLRVAGDRKVLDTD